jgi:nitrogen fixation NifU-like protein
MDDFYREFILDHYKNPHNFGALEGATHRYHDTNPLCGDEITMYLKIDAGDRVEDVAFEGKGCAISVASASILTDEVRGKTLAELKAIDRDHVLENLGITLTPARLKCALLRGLHEWPGEEAKTS